MTSQNTDEAVLLEKIAELKQQLDVLSKNSVPFFPNHAAAKDAVDALPKSVSNILVVNGSAYEFRRRKHRDNPFEGAADPWGCVVQVQGNLQERSVTALEKSLARVEEKSTEARKIANAANAPANAAQQTARAAADRAAMLQKTLTDLRNETKAAIKAAEDAALQSQVAQAQAKTVEDRFNFNYRPLPTSSVLIMGYGQSNMSIAPDGGALNDVILHRPFVQMPNDGWAVRGLVGREPTNPITAMIDVDDFPNGDYQSSVSAAAGAFLNECHGAERPRVIVRVEARGGQPIIGKGERSMGLHLGKDGAPSQPFKNLIATTRSIVEVAAQDGAPVRSIYIPFVHQEADQAMPRKEYAKQVSAMMKDVEKQLKDLNIPITWLLSQAGGTVGRHGGNAWPNRLSLFDLATKRENVHLIQSQYQYPLYDAIHVNNDAKVLMGEIMGLAIAELEKGRSFQLAEALGVTRDGNTLRVEMRSQSPLVFDETHHPMGKSHRGFTVTGTEAQIIRSEIRMNELKDGFYFSDIVLELDQVPSGKSMQLGYAYRVSRGAGSDTGFPAGTGALRENWTRASAILPGKMLAKWVPGFELPFK